MIRNNVTFELCKHSPDISKDLSDQNHILNPELLRIIPK